MAIIRIFEGFEELKPKLYDYVKYRGEKWQVALVSAECEMCYLGKFIDDSWVTTSGLFLKDLKLWQSL